MTAHPVIRALWFIAALCGANTALASAPVEPHPSPRHGHHATHATPPSDHATLLLHSPAPGQHLMDNSPRFSGWATPGHELIILIRDPDGMLVQTLEAQPDASGAWAVEASLMGDGDYHAQLRLRRARQEHDQPSGPARVRAITHTRFTLDTRVPAAYLLSHAPGERVEPGRPIIGMIDEPDAQLTVTLRDELGAVIARHQPPIDEHGAWQLSPVRARAGTYIIETTARDRAGNQVTLARRFIQAADAPDAERHDAPTSPTLAQRGDDLERITLPAATPAPRPEGSKPLALTSHARLTSRAQLGRRAVESTDSTALDAGRADRAWSDLAVRQDPVAPTPGARQERAGPAPGARAAPLARA